MTRTGVSSFLAARRREASRLLEASVAKLLKVVIGNAAL